MLTRWVALVACALPLVLTYRTVPQILYSKAVDGSFNAAENTIQRTDVKGNGNYVERCRGLGGQTGRCVPLHSCVLLNDQRGYFDSKDYPCTLSDGRGHGVCCPDHVETSEQNQNDTNSKASRNRRLPRSPEEKSKTKVEAPSDEEENALDKIYPLGDYKTCGRNGKTTSRTKEDAPTSVKDWPWMVAFINKKTSAQFCGGTLITKRHVLTAAHCFGTKKEPKDIILLVGAYSFSGGKLKTVEVEKIFVHDDFDPTGSLQDDIAVVKMKQAATYNSYVQPCCLPAPGGQYVNLTAVVTGWGSLGSNKSSSDVLMEVEIPVWELKSCETSYVGKIFNTNVCAGASEGGKDACQGDSGGPLTLQRQDGRWVIVGVVSWGAGCGDKGRPGVYTKVSDYLDWIEDKIKE